MDAFPSCEASLKHAQPFRQFNRAGDQLVKNRLLENIFDW